MPEKTIPEEAKNFRDRPKRQEVEIIPVTIWERDIKNMLNGADEQGEESKPFMFKSLRELSTAIYMGKEKELLPLLSELESRDYKSQQEMVIAVAAEMYKFGQNNLTSRELEHNVRQYVISKTEHVINEMLHYGTYKDELYLHVFPVSTLSDGEKLKLLRNGFKQLATQLKTSESLKEIKTVIGTSWIVAQSPGLMQKLGFTNDGEISKEEYEKFFAYETRKVSKAHIDKNKFLELYLPKETD